MNIDCALVHIDWLLHCATRLLYIVCRAEVIAELTPRLKAMKDLYSCWSDDEILYTLIIILKV